MRMVVRALVGAALVASGLSVGTASVAAPASQSAQRYIVVLHDSVSDPGAVAAQHSRDHGGRVDIVYRHALKGYAGAFSEQGLRGVERDRRVDYVELDGVASIVHHRPGHGGGPGESEPPPPEEGDTSPVTCAGPGSQTLPWGIDKVDADVSSILAGNGCDAITNVNVYVIDTGVDTAHADLNVVGHVNYAGGPNSDCNGHGTHVAGTMAAEDNTQDVVGVAPGAPITGVKVLGCSGSGSWSGVIGGIDWVTANARKPAVANMSLGGGASKAVDDAVVKSAASGVTYAVAAGNEGANACTRSPARAGAGTNNGIITVAATDSSDKETSWSNYGNCVDIWAPGASILSTRNGGGTTTMSGTSMASPHAGGGAALYLSGQTTASPSTVEAALTSAATTTANKSKDGTRTVTRLDVRTF